MKLTSFNPVAQEYTSKVSPNRFNQFLTLIHELNLKGDEKVLDIGAGPGVLSIELSRHLNNGGNLKGIDLSANMVRLARSNARQHKQRNVSFEVGDALDLKSEADSFDVVVSSNAYPWVSDRAKFLHEVLRVLKPGGTFGLVALSSECYREFSRVLRSISMDNPSLFPAVQPFEVMGAKLHTLTELGKTVRLAGFDVARNFVLSTREPITPAKYVERINAIVNENYLDHLGSNGKRMKAKKLILKRLAGRNGSLNITESSVFVIAHKAAA